MSSFISNHRYPASADMSQQRRTVWAVLCVAALLVLLRVITFPIPPSGPGAILLSPHRAGGRLNHASTFHSAHDDHTGGTDETGTTTSNSNNNNNNKQSAFGSALRSTNKIISGHYNKNAGGEVDPRPDIEVVHDQIIVRPKRPGGSGGDKQLHSLDEYKNKPQHDSFGYRLGVSGHRVGEADGAVFKIKKVNKKRAFHKSDALKARKIRFSDVADVQERNRKRRDQVREEFKWAWKAYERYAWGWDEVHPIAKKPRSWTDNSHGWAMTIFDSLDTLWIMGLKDEFRKAVKFLDEEFNIKQDYGLSTFEATIRMLGGSLSAYELSGDPRLLRLAEKVGWILIAGLETHNGMLMDHINFKTRGGSQMAWLNGMNLVGEIGTLQMEFRTLSLHLRDPIFDMRVTHLNSILHSGCKLKGYVCPTMFSSARALPASATFTLGGMADSYFEYLVKESVMTGMVEEKLIDMAKTMLKTVSENMIASVELHHPDTGELYHYSYPGTWDGVFGVGTGTRALEHLTCFSGGMFALGALAFKNESAETRAGWAATGAAIAETCYNMYASQPSGLSPEEVQIDNHREFTTTRNEYRLRPETIESIFYLSRIDKNTELWRDRGWEIFDSIMLNCRIPWGGYSGINDVGASRPPTEAELLNERSGMRNFYDDLQQSYAHAELFKYSFMLFQDRDTVDGDTYIDLEEWVFNTEAHPMRVRQRDPRDVWYEWRAKNGGKARWTAPHLDKVTPFYPELEGEYSG